MKTIGTNPSSDAHLSPDTLHVCYSPDYVAPTRVHCMEKLGWIAEELGAVRGVNLVRPQPVAPELLRTLHAPNYVDAFLRGEGNLARSQNLAWSPRLRDAVLAALGGQLLATSIALEAGVAANLAQGFHHARYERGSGYCTFNGLALVAAQHPHLKVAVLDCDEHNGNGTASFCNRLTNLHAISLHSELDRFKNYESERSLALPLPPGPGRFDAYCGALNRAFDYIASIKPDLLIYQAGVDGHWQDPLGETGLTSEELDHRDRAVFRWARECKLPMFFVVAGGYQDRTELVRLHSQSFIACVDEYELAVD